MDIVKQLSIFLDNRPGTLAAVCDELAKANINIFALTISDTVDHAVVRLVVSHAQKALHIFGQHGTMVVENDVLMIENDNQPGSLSKIARKLSANSRCRPSKKGQERKERSGMVRAPLSPPAGRGRLAKRAGAGPG